ncbi:MAG: class I SAM-dependent methyltransferase [DPANN group archaeon]|nr:class I SAM-dependent methyltransferase [DPANN group archaeon]
MKFEHYYAENPKSKYFEYELEDFKIRGIELKLKSAPGVFSAKEVDTASELLASVMQLPKSGQILDLGCGYGLLGLAAAKLSPKAKVILVDINKRAVDLAQKNIKLNKIKNAEARQGNAYGPVEGEVFDAILLNPPMVAGRKIVLHMIEHAVTHLKPKGSLQIVARKSKGGEYLFNKMKIIFSKVEVLARSGGFWVVKGTK